MSARVWPQPLIVVRDVAQSQDFYLAVLGAESGHGGDATSFEAAVERACAHGAEVVTDVHVNPNAKQRELWLRDPDGYTVVIAGPSEYRPR
jgi:hypothetical protein